MSLLCAGLPLWLSWPLGKQFGVGIRPAQRSYPSSLPWMGNPWFFSERMCVELYWACTHVYYCSPALIRRGFLLAACCASRVSIWLYTESVFCFSFRHIFLQFIFFHRLGAASWGAPCPVFFIRCVLAFESVLSHFSFLLFSIVSQYSTVRNDRASTIFGNQV